MDGGLSWISTDMSLTFSHLIDCKFFSADTGIIVGAYSGTGTGSKCRIAYTTNGGMSWQNVVSAADTAHLCWKINFVNRMLGFVSVENELKQDSVFYYQTSDGGKTWELQSYYKNKSYGGQGIGFIDEYTGWCGFQSGDTKMTTDGGKLWTDAPSILDNINRFRKKSYYND